MLAGVDRDRRKMNESVVAMLEWRPAFRGQDLEKGECSFVSREKRDSCSGRVAFGNGAFFVVTGGHF